MIKVFITCSILLTLSLTTSAQRAKVRLEGQVVCCADCWAKSDRSKVEYGSAEDLLVAKSCVEGGDPTLLAVLEGERFKLYQLEEGEFRLPGKNWLEFVGKKVAVTGSVRKSKKAEVVHVDELEELNPSLAERQAENVLGQTIALSLTDLFGAPVDLTQFQGRIIILNFWATYCGPCVKEMPDLAAIQNEYAAFGVQVIGASADENEDRSKVLQFIKDTKINFPVWVGASASDMIRFGLGAALPGTVIIDREGRVVHAISGILDPADLKEKIDRLLVSAEKTARRAQTGRSRAVSAGESSVPS